MRLADVQSHLHEVSERYQVPERFHTAKEKVREHVHAAGDAAYRGAHAAYEMARAHPKTSIGAAIAAAAIIGGVLWYLFADTRHEPVQRRRGHARVRAGGERRRKNRNSTRASA